MYLANPFRKETKSFIDFGDIDSRLYTGDTITYCNGISPEYWAVSINSIAFEDSYRNIVDLVDFAGGEL